MATQSYALSPSLSLDDAHYDDLEVGSFSSPSKKWRYDVDDDWSWLDMQAQKQSGVEQEDADEFSETESFKEWSDMNWAIFDYEFNDSFYDLPKEHFKDSEDPRTGGELDPLKPGYVGMMTLDPNGSRFYPKRGRFATQFAVDSYNERNKGKNSIQLDQVCKINKCLRYPCWCIYFLTFQAIDNAGTEETFQASVAESYGEDHVVMHVRAFRHKPCN